MRIQYLVMVLTAIAYVHSQTQSNIGGAGYDTFDEQQQVEQLRQKPLHWFGSLYFAYSRPRGDFQRFMDSINNKWGLGFGFNGGYHFGDVPLAVGLCVDVLFYSAQERTFENTIVVGGIPRTVYDTVNTSLTIIPLTVLLRIAPDLGWVQPYVEAGGGLSVISSNYSLNSNLTGSQDRSRSSVPFQYSFGAGLNVKIVDVFDLPVSRQAYYVHLGIRYLYGDFTDYTFWRFSGNGSGIDIVTGASRTDLYHVTLGVQASF